MKKSFFRFLLLVFVLFFPFQWLPAKATENSSTEINLRIEGSDKTYFDGKISIKDCIITDSSGVEHSYTNSAACGVVEAAKISNFEYSFKDFGFGLFLTRIGTDDTPTDFSKSWSFWLNDDSSSIGLDAYSPNQNDSILLAYSGFSDSPLRITLPDKIVLNQQFIAKTEKRVGTTDENWVWHGTWEPASGAILHINDSPFIVPENGELAITFTNNTTVISADGSGFVRSPKTTIELTETSPAPTISPSPSPEASPSATPSPTSTPSPTATPQATPLPYSKEERTERAKLALNFLRDLQNENGSIEGSTVTIWSVIAFGANEDRAENIKRNDHSLLNALAENKPESATDLERLIIALRATGQNPHSFNKTDYVKLLKNKFNNNQFGEEALINDDIFGVLAMLAADESANSDIVHDVVNTLLKKQSNEGLWENVDLTAATVQALMAYKKANGNINIDENISKAKTALKNNQDELGGFGKNSATTAWGIQAIISLGEDPSDWKLSDENNPWTALLLYQNPDGGFGWKTDNDSSGFMTAYAISALLGSPWPISKLEIINSAIDEEESTIISTPTPSPTPINKKIVSSIVSPQKTQNYVKHGIVAGEELSPTPSPTTFMYDNVIADTTKNKKKDNTKSLALELGFANIGVGITIARIVSKIRAFV